MVDALLHQVAEKATLGRRCLSGLWTRLHRHLREELPKQWDQERQRPARGTKLLC